MGFGVAPKQGERSVNVAQGAERGVHGGLLEDRAWVEDARELCGGQTPGVERELLDPAQALDRGGTCVLHGHAGRLQMGNAGGRWIVWMTRWIDGEDLRSCVAG